MGENRAPRPRPPSIPHGSLRKTAVEPWIQAHFTVKRKSGGQVRGDSWLWSPLPCIATGAIVVTVMPIQFYHQYRAEKRIFKGAWYSPDLREIIQIINHKSNLWITFLYFYLHTYQKLSTFYTQLFQNAVDSSHHFAPLHLRLGRSSGRPNHLRCCWYRRDRCERRPEHRLRHCQRRNRRGIRR